MKGCERRASKRGEMIMETQTTVNMHGENWTRIQGANGTAYVLDAEGMYGLTVFYAGGNDYAYVIQDEDNGEILTWWHAQVVAEYHYPAAPIGMVLVNALDMLGEEEDAAAVDQSEYVDGWDNTDYDDVPEDFMRADSDLQYEW